MFFSAPIGGSIYIAEFRLVAYLQGWHYPGSLYQVWTKNDCGHFLAIRAGMHIIDQGDGHIFSVLYRQQFARAPHLARARSVHLQGKFWAAQLPSMTKDGPAVDLGQLL